MSNVEIWWISLCLISAINIVAWIYSKQVFNKHKTSINPNIYIWRRMILWLSGAYVAGCAFRSFFPRIDLERICLVDTWFSNMLVGRSVATIAEVCFIAQCAILLREAAIGTHDRVSVVISYALIPMIIIAECFSWYAILSTDYLGSVIEESIWTVAGTLLIISFISLWPRVENAQRHFLSAMIIFAIGFVIFMVTVDVPMYWNRWQADSAAGLQYLPFNKGILDISKNYVVNFDWQIWREEIPWMTLYFTIAVWVSIYLTHAPNFKIAAELKST